MAFGPDGRVAITGTALTTGSEATVGFWVTAADRPHLAAVAAPPWTPPGSEHPYLRQTGQHP